MLRLMRESARTLAVAIMAVAVIACSDNGNDGFATQDNGGGNGGGGSAPTENIVETAISAGSFETLVAALQATSLDAVLGDDTATFTVFAPTDEAFAELGQTTIDALLMDTDTLSDILLYHVIQGQAVDADAAIALAGTLVEMANGDNVAISVRDGELFINDSQVVSANIETTNGIIHVIDVVLSPPEDMEPAGNIVEVAQAAGSFGTLLAAAGVAGLDTVLGDDMAEFTVFAPTDAAFAKLGQDTIDGLLNDPDTLADILLYHVIQGSVDAVTALSLAGTTVDMANDDFTALTVREGELFINESEVIDTDIAATNGIIHVIDTVLIPPADVTPTQTITEIAVADDRFETLVAALGVADLADTLNNADLTFTVFAPTDAAFELLGSAVDDLIADPSALESVLLYHVISGVAVDSITATSLIGTDVTMANTDSTALSIGEGGLQINDSTIIITDIQATNGVIHVIDRVLIPPVPPVE